MNKLLLSGICFLLCVAALPAQEQNICIMPYLPDEVDIPERARNALKHKLLQVVTTNGFGSTSDAFVLAANVTVIEKEAVPVVPPQINLQIEVSLYVVNTIEKVIVDEKSFILSGIDKTENSAFAQALKQLNPRAPQVRTFMSSVREKIVDFYAQRTPVLIAKAQSLAKMGKLDEAIITLSVVPESVPEYTPVAELMAELYKKKINSENSRILLAAKAALANRNYSDALSLLSQVDPLSDCFGEAVKMIHGIQHSIEEEERMAKAEQLAELQKKMELDEKKRADEVMLKKAQVEASYKFASAASKEMSEAVAADMSWLTKLLELE